MIERRARRRAFTLIDPPAATSRRRAAFTLVELLVVIGIIAVLIAVMLPSLRKARLAAQTTVCASQLRQIGNALLMYTHDNKRHLPRVIEPLWKSNGTLDWDADPSINDPADPNSTPDSFLNVMKPYLRDMRVLLCPSANLGYPRKNYRCTYRISSANNFDGQVAEIQDLVLPSGVPKYTYSLKYLNGRVFRLEYVDAHALPLQLKHGVGPYYLVRDLVGQDSTGTFHPPHGGSYNQLLLDMSVTFTKDTSVGFTYP